MINDSMISQLSMSQFLDWMKMIVCNARHFTLTLASATNEFGANHCTRGWIIDVIVGIFVDNKEEANE